MSHRLSRRLNNATGQCSVVCPSHVDNVDNDGTVACGILTSRCPVVCPVVPSLFRPTGHVMLSHVRDFCDFGSEFRDVGVCVCMMLLSRRLTCCSLAD